MSKHLDKVIGVIIGILFLSSLTLECYLVDGEKSIGSFGLIAFLLGWLNFDIVGLIWLANPLFFISLFILIFFSKKRKAALFLSLIAFLLAISFTQVEEIIKNEAGFTGKITGYLTGYWLWVSANFTLFLYLLINTTISSPKYK